tara:strand:- start:66 stop:548 length:483 start_codon:yes stop_codon:yes gene_type:complete
MELYLKLIDVILPVFFIIGIGYYLGIKNPKFNTDFITTLAGNIGTPAMIFYTITSTDVTLGVFIEYFVYALIMIGGFAIIGFIFLFILQKDMISELPPLILPNTGNMIKYLLFAALFVTLVFFSLNYWEKIKKTKKNSLKNAFSAIFIVCLSFLIYLLYD